MSSGIQTAEPYCIPIMLNKEPPPQSQTIELPSILPSVHRTISHTILQPITRIFGGSTTPFYEMYYDQSEQKIIKSTKQINPVKLQFSFHLCSKRFMDNDVKIVFPDFKRFSHIYAIPTFQEIGGDMTAFSVENGELKDHMLDNTMSIMLTIYETLQQRMSNLNNNNNNNNNNNDLTYLFDCSEPSSGLPYLTTSTSSVYSEVDGSGGTLLRYQREQAGSCCLLKHPQYGTSCYPSTFFLGMNHINTNHSDINNNNNDNNNHNNNNNQDHRTSPLTQLFNVMMQLSEPIVD